MKTMLKKLLFFMLVLPLSVLAQNNLTGKVTDASSNQAMSGVSVVITGTSNGTFTNSDGTFTLKNVKSGDNVSFSFLGFKTETIAYTNQQNISVSLQQDGQGIEEVLVVGYGKVKKKDATGSVTQISSKDFNRGATPTVENLLNGRVAGLQINTGGGPGSRSDIRIRGGASITATNDPLIVVDGLPISNESPAGSRNFLATLDPNTVESISVLKDASATAIYGSRASNGVIIITTKKGGKKLKVDYNFQYGTGKHYRKIDVLSSDEFVAKVQQLYPAQAGSLGVPSGIADNPTTPNINESRTIYNTDWQEEIFRPTDYVTNNLNLSGSLFDKVPARLSVGNTYQEGLIMTDKFNRNTAGLNLSPSLFKDHLKLTLNASISNEKNNFARTPIGSAIRFDPTKPVYDSSSPYGGYFQWLQSANDDGIRLPIAIGAPQNPVAQLLQRNNSSYATRSIGNIQFDYKMPFLPELRANLNLGYDTSSSEGSNNIYKSSTTVLTDGSNPGNESTYKQNKTNLLWDFYMNYATDLSSINSSIDVMAGYSYQNFLNEGFNNSISATNEESFDYYNELNLQSFFSRVKFSVAEKYLLTLTYRRDGSSRFSEKNRWGNFPSAAFAWKIYEEPFMKDNNTITNLNLRLSWGITGQQDIPASYAFLGRHVIGDSFSQYIFGNTAVVVGIPQSKFEDIKWEETTTYNVGIDYGFFNDKLKGSIEVYLKESNDLLANVAVADGSNFSNAGWQNIGQFTSKGLEFMIGSDIVSTNDLNVNVSYNLNLNETKIDELAFGQDIEVGGISGGTGSRIQVHREGFAPYSYFVYKQLYDTAGAPIEGAYADINQDGIINPSDRYIYKKPSADISMGFQTGINYKDFDLGFNLRAEKLNLLRFSK